MLIEEEFSKEDKIPFPFQYLEEYFYGKCSFDNACARTLDELDRLIEEYIKNHNKEEP